MTRIIRYKDSKQSLLPNYSMQFNGVDNRFLTTGIDPITQSISISCWFKTSILPIDSSVIVNDDPSFPGSRIEIRPWAVRFNRLGGILFILTHTNGSINQMFSNTNGLNNGEWHHIACVYDGGQTRTPFMIYIDGVLDSISTSPGIGIKDLGALNNGIAIGCVSAPDVSGSFDWFEGLIDDVQVWKNIVLGDDQINDIFNAGPSVPVALFSPTHRWQMGESANFDGLNWLMPDDGVSPIDMVSENINFTGRTTDVV